MKQAILTVLSRLTNAMKADSRSFHVSFLPIIQSAIEPGSETQVYLLEDALDLWSSIVVRTIVSFVLLKHLAGFSNHLRNL
jgi:hypothetical protein